MLRVQHVAVAIGVAMTPAEVDFARRSVPCPAAACTGYAQGGSRVKRPDGFGNAAGCLTVPGTTRVERRLQRHGRFTDNDPVLVAVGNNDGILAHEAHMLRALATQADLAAARIDPAQAATGSSLWCNATPGSPLTGLIAGVDPERPLFADFIHPTTGGHRVFAQDVLQALRRQGSLR